MSLEDDIKKLFERKHASILLVDDRLCADLHDVKSTSSYDPYYAHIVNEEETETYARANDISLGLMDAGHKGIVRWNHMVDQNLDFALVYLDSMHNRNQLPEALASVSHIRERAPDARIIIFGDTTSAAHAGAKVLSTHLGISPELEYHKIDSIQFPTLMHYLSQQVRSRMVGGNQESESASQHRHKNEMWDNYLPFIDKSLNAGNLQTAMGYHFLVLSDREREALGHYETPHSDHHKVQVGGSDYNLTQENFDSCAAIFIDNAWDPVKHSGRWLGDGIEILKRVRKELDEKGIDIPIIYQSGHCLETFSDSELEQIAGLGAVISSKDLFPKVSLDKEKAAKETDITKHASVWPQLLKYLAQVTEAPVKRKVGDKEMIVTMTKIVTPPENDETKDMIFDSLGIEDGDAYITRMYVLSLFHSALKPFASRYSSDAAKIFDYSFLEGRFTRKGLSEIVGEDSVAAINLAYDKAISNKDLYNITVLAHNDAKWDNWFKPGNDPKQQSAPGIVLGDYADVSGGNEYKDLARALMDKETDFKNVKDRDWVRSKVEGYLKLRGFFDRDFNVDGDTFAKNVYDMILIESFRLASKKSGVDKDLTRELLDITMSYVKDKQLDPTIRC